MSSRGNRSEEQCQICFASTSSPSFSHLLFKQLQAAGCVTTHLKCTVYGSALERYFSWLNLIVFHFFFTQIQLVDMVLMEEKQGCAGLESGVHLSHTPCRRFTGRVAAQS